ncbi:uncharacterized protein LOC134686559 isoform X2 [Mytilus trossulus]|uniref:uncharacterized protein LOC134686559 isoform X2 n=1 Tax=Mytilus trossulus TaxID=6551 RepID=UPI00300613DD
MESQFSCSGPVFQSKYVPPSLSKDPVNISQQLYHDTIHKLSTSHLVKGRHCRNLWCPSTLLWIVLFLTMNGFGIVFIIFSVRQQALVEELDKEHAQGKELYTTAKNPHVLFIMAGVCQSIGLFTILWSGVCCYSEYKNHIALEKHNKRIRQRQNGGEMEFIMNHEDNVHLLDDTTEIPMDDDLQERITELLLNLSSAYLMEYMNERLDLPIDSIRHASQAKCLCQFAESINTNLDNVINV